MQPIDLRRTDRVLVIAEVGQNHDGSLGQAHAYIDAAARAGADVVKFQTHIAEAESTAHDRFRVNFSYEDASRYDYWKRMEFAPEHWAGLKTHAEEQGLHFMSSAFSVAAFELLERLDVAAWKVGSGEIQSLSLLRAMARTGKPMLVSTGMSGFAEIDRIGADIAAHGGDCMFLQCCSRYPSSLADVGTNVVAELARRTGRPAGYSDHSGTMWPALAAVAAGAAAIEAHITMSREMFGPDVASSLTTADFATMVAGIRAFSAIATAPVDKDRTADELAPMRGLFMKGAFARRDLAAGEVLAADMVDWKKPALGLTEPEYEAALGRALARGVAAGEPVAASAID